MFFDQLKLLNFEKNKKNVKSKKKHKNFFFE